MLKESLHMSWQNIRANKMRSFLTILGIVIGIASVIAMTSLIGGIQNSLVNSLGLNAARMVQIYSSQELTESDIEKLQKLVPQIEQIGIVDSAYTEYVTKVLDEADMQIGDLSKLYHVYVGEAVEATVAYASVNADTQLLDMPGGDAVADVKAGASMDVLGSITEDGKTYSFVAVPGTEIKGYIGADELNEMDADAALAVDNAALVSGLGQLDKNPTFTIAMNDGSLIYGELYPEKAPESVGNFVSLANSSFYDGLTFHRVISGFMIQGGDPNGDGTGGPGYAIRGEFSSNGVENDLSHVRGVLSMARSMMKDSAGSQFFIMTSDSPHLDGAYAAFGKVTSGMEVADGIVSQRTDRADKPLEPQVIASIRVETNGIAYPFTKL